MPFRLPRFTETKYILEKRKKAAHHRSMQNAREEIYDEQFHLLKVFYALTVLAVLYSVWLGVKRPIYQWIYGERTDFDMTISDKEVFLDLGDLEIIDTSAAGHDINIKIKKVYSVTGKIVYVDRYDSRIGTWFRSPGNPGAAVYDDVIPLDLSVAHGGASKVSPNEFSHEYRLLLGPQWVKQDEVNNNHTIPATNTIAKGLEILKPGDVAYLKGYLVDWKEKGAIEYIETASYAGETWEELMMDGSNVGMCRQLYLTKLIFDGYVFE